MVQQAPPAGRRERNKQAKLDRIIAAAGGLFAEHGIDEVTTQQVADAADIATGTLFLYARTKTELLLLVQNAHYREALEEGLRDSADCSDPTDAVMALLTPIIRCNRVQYENGRVYLREIAFGDTTAPNHAEAVAIVEETQHALAETLTRTISVDPETATVMASLVTGAQLLSLAGAAESDSDEDVAANLRRAVEVLVATPKPKARPTRSRN
jgi:TetR/AcrR family transcriptional regulator